MCDVLQLQPAGAFLRQTQNLRRFSNPIAVVGSCTDIDQALRLECDEEARNPAAQVERGQQDEPEDFLASIRRGLDELEEEEDSEEEDSDDEGCYYQASKDNTYYSPDQKLPADFLLDDALDLSDTSTASSSQPAPWARDEEEQEDLIFQLEM